MVTQKVREFTTIHQATVTNESIKYVKRMETEFITSPAELYRPEYSRKVSWLRKSASSVLQGKDFN